MPELLEMDFCDGLEMKFTSPFGGIQLHQKQLRKALLLVLLSVSGYLQARIYKFVFHYYQFPHAA